MCVRLILACRVRMIRQDGDVSSLLGVAEREQEIMQMGLDDFKLLSQ